MAKTFKVLYQNITNKRVKRVKSPLYKELQKCEVGTIHRHIVDRFDYWQVCSEEGKYAVASGFHRKRLMARVWCMIVLESYQCI